MAFFWKKGTVPAGAPFPPEVGLITMGDLEYMAIKSFESKVQRVTGAINALNDTISLPVPSVGQTLYLAEAKVTMNTNPAATNAGATSSNQDGIVAELQGAAGAVLDTIKIGQATAGFVSAGEAYGSGYGVGSVEKFNVLGLKIIGNASDTFVIENVLDAGNATATLVGWIETTGQSPQESGGGDGGAENFIATPFYTGEVGTPEPSGGNYLGVGDPNNAKFLVHRLAISEGVSDNVLLEDNTTPYQNTSGEDAVAIITIRATGAGTEERHWRIWDSPTSATATGTLRYEFGSDATSGKMDASGLLMTCPPIKVSNNNFIVLECVDDGRVGSNAVAVTESFVAERTP